ncbi:MAG: ornithine cyclodeaminase family protein [archaeon]|nr:ornithine cyclodeaminase family protein [archaeon]
MVLLLSGNEVKELLDMKSAIEAVEMGFTEIARGEVIMPQRASLKEPAPGLTLIMPANIPKMKALACKIVTVYKENPSKFGLATVLGKTMIQNYDTGEIECIMDAGYATAMRTGAATGVSIKHLARKDSNKVGLYGAGVQARKQLVAAATVLGSITCNIHDPIKKASEQFKIDMEKELGIEINIVEKQEDVINNADIIICASTATTPLFDGKKVMNGAHISSIGAHAPASRELDEYTVLNGKLYADFKDACLAEAGDYIIPINENKLSPDKIVSIGNVVLGKAEGRTSDKEITIFKSVGIAVQDVAVAKKVFDIAKEKGIGTEVDF